MKETTYHLKAKTIGKAMEEIKNLFPEATSMVKGRKGDRFDYFIHGNEKKSAKWSRVTDLAIKLGWAKEEGSNLTIMEF